MRKRRRGILWICGCLVLGLPSAALVIPNLWLASPVGRSWIANKISRATGGLETRVGRTSISPWHGIGIDSLEILQPASAGSSIKDPLISIDHVRLVPVWSAWLHQRKELQAIELDSPRGVVSIEWLESILRSHIPPPQPNPPPAIAAATPQPPTIQPSPATTIPTTPVQPNPTPQPSPPPIPAPTAWIHLKNASCSLVSATTGQSWFDLRGVSGAIPIAGGPASATLSLASCAIGHQTILNHLTAHTSWSAPILSLDPVDLTIDGLHLTASAKLAIAQGLPIQIEAHLPPQPANDIHLLESITASAAECSADARFQALLLAPPTWQAECIALTKSPSTQLGDRTLTFDRGSAITILRGGMLSCLDARLISDDLSLLGNATLLADGRLAANLRLVAPPETATSLANRFFPNMSQPPSLTPLSTPQRAALDLQAFGDIRQLSLRLGNNDPTLTNP